MRKLILVFIGLLCSIGVCAQEVTPSNVITTDKGGIAPANLSKLVRPVMTVPKLTKTPVIDGKLDDEVWKEAVVFKDLIQTQPGDNIPASRSTEVYLGYDERNLYVAFKCLDEKDKIRATVTLRDNVFSEDNVRIWLDTYNDKRHAYILAFNPLGIQQDGIYTEGQGPDFSPDILMESKGSIEDWGWSVEVKIPFKSLRYTAGKGKFWGVNVARNISRLDNEFDSWVPLPRGVQGFINQFGTMKGLDEIKTERTLQIIPTMTFKETGKRISQNKFSNPPITPDFGFTAKYSITPNVTLDAAYNPDFADTEADAPVVQANQRFPIFFAEKRPFFLEGVDIFQTPIQAVYTRKVENPDVALKLTGKVGKNSFGVFGAVDEPLFNPYAKKAYIGVARFKRDFGKESNIGFLATSYNYPNKHNQLAGFDGRWKINKSSEFNAQILGTTSKNYFYNPNKDTDEYRVGNGISYSYSYSYEGKNHIWGFSGDGTTKDYRADVGFFGQTNTMNNSVYVGANSDPHPKNNIIQKFATVSFGTINDFYGRWQGWGLNSNVNLSMKGNMQIGGGASLGLSNIYEDEFGPKRNVNQSGAFFNDPKRSVYTWGGFGTFNRTFNKKFALNGNINLFLNTFDYDFGAGRNYPRVSPAALAFGQGAPLDPGAAKNFTYKIGATYRPTDKMNFAFAYRKSTLTRNDTGLVAYNSNIFQFLTRYQFTRFVALRTRIDYDTLTNRIFGQYTFAWTPSPGKSLYIGYNDNWNYKGYAFGQPQNGFLQLNRTFFVKLSYLFQKHF
ncbi:MAG: carbohydrate binding family 9 domain-containing protein [Pyrinomonadaceae bacterium]|nr:carbohydrate binding family 9 domain-containing protein [Pyrinomonadaceae bacterium]